MQLGHQHLQIWINTGIFAFTVMAAFVCDLLRRKNQQLRELALELTVRNQESERREQLLLARTGTPTVQEPSTLEAVNAALPALTIPQPEVEIKLAMDLAIEDAAAKDAPKPSELSTQSVRSAGRKNRRDRTKALSPDAAASIERGRQMATDPRLNAKIKKLVTTPRMIDPQPWQDSEPLPASDLVAELFERHAARSEAAHARKYASVDIDTVPVSSPLATTNPALQTAVSSITQGARALEANRSGKKNWSALLSRQTTGTAPKNEVVDALVAITAEPVAMQNPVPAGFYDGQVLSQIVRSNQPVSGLVVSIGVSGPVSSETHGRVADLMRSLLGPTDFGCQSGEEEFLLIYTGERGASAQRRLSSIAQQLWNFQLSAMGKFEILFSWGGMEVRSEAVETAIASAKDRMIETKRGRKLANHNFHDDPNVLRANAA